jgi:hypothetical protein
MAAARLTISGSSCFKFVTGVRKSYGFNLTLYIYTSKFEAHDDTTMVPSYQETPEPEGYLSKYWDIHMEVLCSMHSFKSHHHCSSPRRKMRMASQETGTALGPVPTSGS